MRRMQEKSTAFFCLGFISISFIVAYVNASLTNLRFQNLASSHNSSIGCFTEFSFEAEKSMESLEMFIQLLVEETIVHTVPKSLGNLLVRIEFTERILLKTIETDESYAIEFIKEKNRELLEIKASNNYGVIYALQDIAQMTEYNFEQNCYALNKERSKLLLNEFKPRFRHREILIDTSRHYLSVKTIFSVLRTMSKAKFNVLHWHLSDSQSFPICLRKYKDICKVSSFSQQERYTEGDVKEIVSFANIMGIRVIPELDIPGHSAAILKAFPDLKACADVFNVGSKETYKVVEGLITELSKLFPDEYFHVGGDEVNNDCWARNARMIRWMKKNNFDESDAYAFFMSKVHNILFDLGKKPIVWDEAFKTFQRSKFDLSTKVTVQLWHHMLLPNFINRGFSVIWSEAKHNGWYLDHLEDKWIGMYQQNLCSGLTLSQCSEFIIGGGGLMWGEKIDASNILNTIWPRAAVIAKNLWDGNEEEIPTVNLQLQQFRCLLLKLDFGSGTISSARAREGPSRPGPCAT